MKRELLFLFTSLLISITTFAQVVANQPDDLVVCDDNLDQFYDWDLSVQDATILGGQDPNLFQVTYHITQQDADFGSNPLSNPYTNTSNPQTIYATVNDLANGIAATTNFNLIVNTLPINSFGLDMIACGNGQPGFAFFDLTLSEIDFTQGTTGLSISYFEDINDAFNDVNPILNPSVYQNIIAYSQLIYLRITDVNTGCFYVSLDTVLYLNVEDVPAINTPTPLLACDDDGDGFASFSLESKIDEIVGTNANYSITFHETQADADSEVNTLNSPYFNTIANQQTIYVRVASQFSGCFTTTALQLQTQINCFTIYPASLTVCDDLGNGFATFDLNLATQQILGNLDPVNYITSYFSNETDALNNTNPLPTTYNNLSNPEVIIVKVVGPTGDIQLTTLTLEVVQLPTPDFDPSYDICDGQSVTLVVGTPNTGVYNATWSLDGVVIPGATSFALIVNSPGVYSVTVIEENGNCAVTASTIVTVGNSANLVQPSDLIDCNGTATGSVFFDLTSQNNTVLAGLDPANYPISFYLSQQDAITPQNQITNATNFEAINTQTIFMRVDNPSGSCPAIFQFQLNIDNCPTIVDCTTGPVNTIFCYVNGADNTYVFTSSDGNPLSVFFNSGFVENTWDELIILDSDGVTNLNAITPYGNAGDVTGLVFTSSGDTITVIVDEDTIFSCETEGYQPLDFDVTCVDSTATPNCNATLTSPLNGAVNVNENTDLIWSPASVLVTGYRVTLVTATGLIVVDNLDVGNVLTYTLPQLDFSTQYFVSIIPYNANGDATGCTDQSFTTRADPNQPVDCASSQPINNTFCYVNSDTNQYSYTSSDGSPLLIVFNAGKVETNWDELIIIDSDGVTNLNAGNPYGNAGDLTGLQFVTTGDSVTIFVQADGSVSCETSAFAPIDFDVFCASNVGFIEVNAFLDLNNDGVFNGNDTPFNNGVFTYEVNDDTNINTVTSTTGNFTITNQDNANFYDITFVTNSGYENCYDIPTGLFENITVTAGNTTIVDFPVTEIMQCEDVAVYLVPSIPPRPGFLYWNNVVIENLGSSTVTSGSVEFMHDPIVTFVEVWNPPTTGTITLTATGFIYDFVNLQPGESISMYADMTVPATTALGTMLTNTITYLSTANDVVADNNTASVTQEVIGSYDPNDIMESYGPEIVYDDFITTNEYLYYTIRFQNVGTAEAINVRIENTLNGLLDSNTMQMLKSSHDVVTHRLGNKLTWTFDNINLPAEVQDERGSNGFVVYKIKPVAGYNLGTLIPNTAEIYFDFNAPVITNTFTSTFVEPALSVDEFGLNTFSLYPNPASTDVNIRFSNALRGSFALTVIDIQGKHVLSTTVNADATNTFNVSGLQSGMYFVKLKNSNTEHIHKLIVK